MTTAKTSQVPHPTRPSAGKPMAEPRHGAAVTESAVRFMETDDSIGVLTFDRPGSSANVFDNATLTGLATHLDAIEQSRRLKGVVLCSAKPSIFIAGADLHAIYHWSDRPGDPPSDELVTFLELGQRGFDRLSRLSVPVVAAIHGACVGGGYEICLACDYRIASPDRTTRIGLPETRLGLLPAWGGSTRLPRLIGLPGALDVILNGRTLSAVPALKGGLIDELVPRERLVEVACERIRKLGSGLKQRSRPLRVLLNHRPAAWVLTRFLAWTVAKRTRGHYPAVTKALEVVGRGVSQPVDSALALERQAILELAASATTRNLIRAFLLQERAKKLRVNSGGIASEASGGGVKTGDVSLIRRAMVIGAGTMGAGITQWLSSRGVFVIMRDVNPRQVGKGLAGVANLYAAGLKRHVFTRVEARQGMDRIAPVAADVPLRNVDLVIEAAVEKLPLKQDIFRRLGEQAPPAAILATNTSALSVSELASVTKHPERVVGIHFFNPVHRMQLVEVVAGRQTSLDALQRAVRFVQQIGKLPVVVKDRPGFLVNRILMPYLIEAGRLFERGARTRDIDEAMLDFGMPMGPLRLIDEVGVDVALHVAETLAGHFSDRLKVPDILGSLATRDLLGRKARVGFYTYTGRRPKPVEYPRPSDAGDAARLMTRQQLQRRMVVLMVNEAARCLEEEVAAGPEDVDFAMIMGTGFAPFRGGPLRYADSAGVAKLVDEMRRLAETGEGQFEPCALLKAMAMDGKSFYPA